MWKQGKSGAETEERGVAEETGSGDIQAVSCLAVSSDGIIAVALERFARQRVFSLVLV